jgi:hypothetical protein
VKDWDGPTFRKVVMSTSGTDETELMP